MFTNFRADSTSAVVRAEDGDFNGISIPEICKAMKPNAFSLSAQEETDPEF